MATNIMANPMLFPTAQVDAEELARQQKYADLLRQQAFTPTEGKMVGNIYVKPSITQGLAKMMQAYGARTIEDEAVKHRAEIAQKQAETLRAMFGGGTTDANAGSTAALTQGAMQGDIGPTVGNQERLDTIKAQGTGEATQGGGMSIPGMNPNQAMMAYSMAPDKYMESYMKQYDPTETARLAREAGVSPKQYALARLMKEGTQAFQPGQMNVLPNGQRIVAPDFKEGISGGFDENGNPTMRPIQGAEQTIGALQYAKEYPKASLNPYKIDLPSGPVLSNQAVAAGATSPTMQGSPLTAQIGNQSLDLRGMPIEQAMQLGMKIQDPTERQNFFSLLASSQAQQQKNPVGGIPLQGETASAFGSKLGGAAATTLMESRDKANIANDTIANVQQAREAITSGAYQGTGAEAKLAVAKFVNANIPGVNIDPNKVSNTDYLKSVLGEGLLKEAKTLGSNPSNADANRINDIVGTIGKDPQAMSKILDWREEMAKKAISRHNATVQDAEKEGMRAPYNLRVKPISAQPPSGLPTPSAIDAEIARRSRGK